MCAKLIFALYYSDYSNAAQFFFRSRSQKRLTDDSHLVYYDKSRIDTFIRFVMTLFGAVLLMVPIFVLYIIQETGLAKDMVVLGFTLLFAVFLAVSTKAKRHELFAATAG